MLMVSETLSNAQMAQFAQMAFGDVADAKQQLVQLADTSEDKDIVIGSVVLEAHMTPCPMAVRFSHSMT